MRARSCIRGRCHYCSMFLYHGVEWLSLHVYCSGEWTSTLTSTSRYTCSALEESSLYAFVAGLDHIEDDAMIRQNSRPNHSLLPDCQDHASNKSTTTRCMRPRLFVHKPAFALLPNHSLRKTTTFATSIVSRTESPARIEVEVLCKTRSHPQQCLASITRCSRALLRMRSTNTASK
jgi:hypothetical protein